MGKAEEEGSVENCVERKSVLDEGNISVRLRQLRFSVEESLSQLRQMVMLLRLLLQRQIQRDYESKSHLRHGEKL